MTNPGNNYDEELGKNVPQRFRAMLTDIVAGIIYSQQFAETLKEKSTFDMKKVKKYKPQTLIPHIVKKALRESGYRKEYEWPHEKKFLHEERKIEIKKYDITTSDWCLVEIDGVETKISKRYLIELWEGGRQIL